MKLKTEVIIDADPATVWRYFDDPDKLSQWQAGLKSVTHQSGTRGQPDSVSVFVYENNGRERTVTETITARREPDFLAGTRQSEDSNAVVVNHFEETEDGRTRWLCYRNHMFKGVARFTTLFTHGAIRRRAEEDMNRFKLLVETGEARSQT